MILAQGTLSILDATATCYKRIWCIYEVYISTVQQCSDGYMFDVYTVAPNGESIGLTDGFVAADGTSKPARRKRHREQYFPFELIEKAMEIELQTAQASEEGDRRCILNVISQQADLSASPPTQHDNYDVLNFSLQGRFAAASLVKVVTLGKDLSNHTRALTNSRLKRLSLHFGEDTKAVSDEAVKQIADSLPYSTLEVLITSFASCNKLSNQSALAFSAALEKMSLLQELDLRFSCGPKIQADGFAAVCRALHFSASTLKEVRLEFNSQVLQAETARTFCAALSKLRKLEHLAFNVDGCRFSQDATSILEQYFATRTDLTPFIENSGSYFKLSACSAALRP